MLLAEVRRALDRRATEDHVAGLVDLLLAEPEELEQREARLLHLLVAHAQALERLGAEHVLAERLRKRERPAQTGLDLGELFRGHSLVEQELPRRVRSAHEGVGPDHVRDDLGHLRLRVAEPQQRALDRRVDDLEVPAAGELLELHQRKV
ncbi:MAG: hypothetical protein ACK56I_22450, partial [bacterium]